MALNAQSDSALSEQWFLPEYWVNSGSMLKTLYRKTGDDMLNASGIGGLILLIANIYAIVMVIQSREKTGMKVLWVVLILILPLIGLVAWFFAGPGKKPFWQFSVVTQCGTQDSSRGCVLLQGCLLHAMNDNQKNNPLHGVTLEKIVTRLVEHYGWDDLAERININCFKQDPSIKSSLKFLRRTQWARDKVEKLYVATFETINPWGPSKTKVSRVK